MTIYKRLGTTIFYVIFKLWRETIALFTEQYRTNRITVFAYGKDGAIKKE